MYIYIYKTVQSIVICLVYIYCRLRSNYTNIAESGIKHQKLKLSNRLSRVILNLAYVHCLLILNQSIIHLSTHYHIYWLTHLSSSCFALACLKDEALSSSKAVRAAPSVKITKNELWKHILNKQCNVCCNKICIHANCNKNVDIQVIAHDTFL